MSERRAILSVQNRWFALADLVIVTAGSIALFINPQLSWWPLIIALVPWAIRLLAGQFPFRRTRLDIFLFLFLLTAFMGIWTTYDQAAAWEKLRFLLFAVLLYYAVAGQPQSNIWFLTGIFVAIGFVVAVTFLYVRGWEVDPAKFNLVDQLRSRFLTSYTEIPVLVIYPDVADSFIALIIPFITAVLIRAWRERRLILLFITLITLGFCIFDLTVIEASGATMSLGVGMGIWFLWNISGYVARRTALKRPLAFLLLFLLAGLAVSSIFFSGLLRWESLIFDLEKRALLSGEIVQLIVDFPIIGSGLSSFDGLYSQYILDIPFFYIGQGHNLFLNVVLEQSFLGLLALLGILIGSGWLLVEEMRSSKSEIVGINILRWAILASLITMVLNGMIDDTLYGQRGTPWLFVLPAMSVAVTQAGHQPVLSQSRKRRTFRESPWLKIAVIFGVFLVAIFFGIRRPLTAQWYANLGAIQMAKTELAGWPLNRWDDGSNAAALKPAASLFQQALSYDPENQTAQHRLGLIAMKLREYETAVIHLVVAYNLDGKHHGILKSLAYSYVWSGDLENALELAVDIPEARDEMDVYSWWWGIQGRPDLVQNASQMVSILDSASTPKN